MNFYEKIMSLDRRWVYLTIGVVVVVPNACISIWKGLSVTA